MDGCLNGARDSGRRVEFRAVVEWPPQALRRLPHPRTGPPVRRHARQPRRHTTASLARSPHPQPTATPRQHRHRPTRRPARGRPGSSDPTTPELTRVASPTSSSRNASWRTTPAFHSSDTESYWSPTYAAATRTSQPHHRKGRPIRKSGARRRTRSRLNGLCRGPGGVIVGAGEGIVGTVHDVGLRGCRPHAQGMLLNRIVALMPLTLISSACLNPDSIPALAGRREVPRLLLHIPTPPHRNSRRFPPVL